MVKPTAASRAGSPAPKAKAKAKGKANGANWVKHCRNFAAGKCEDNSAEHLKLRPHLTQAQVEAATKLIKDVKAAKAAGAADA